MSKPKYRKVSSSTKQTRSNPKFFSSNKDSWPLTRDMFRGSNTKSRFSSKQSPSSSSKGFVSALAHLVKDFAALLARIISSFIHIAAHLFSLLFTRVTNSKTLLLFFIISIVAGASLGVDALANTGKVYKNVRVGTIEAGGMSVDELEEAILLQYEPFLHKQIYVFSDEEASLDLEASLEITNDSAFSDLHTTEETQKHIKVWVTSTEELDVGLDAATLAKKAYDRGRADGGLVERFNILLHGCEIPLDFIFDEIALDSLASDIDKTIGVVRINYGVEILDSFASVTAGIDGDMVNRTKFAEEISASLLEGGEDVRIVAKTEEAPLQITEEVAQSTCDEINHVTSKGALFLYNDSSWEVAPEELIEWIQIEEVESEGIWTLRPSLSYDLARPTLHLNMKANFYEEDVPVRFRLEGDTIIVVPEAGGTIPHSKEATENLSVLLFDTPQDLNETPRVEVGSTEIPEYLVFDEALELGIIDLVSAYTTEYSSGMENRNYNIHLAADLLSPSIISAHGGEWSLNETTGDYNEEAGFKPAGAIADGEFIDSIGGGVCQVATTVFNSIYHAGYPIVTRHNHSLYMPSYPDGLDAAVSWPHLDLKWRNDTSSDVLLLSSYTDTSLTISLYSVDPGYVVTSFTGPWEKGEDYKTKKVYDDSLAKGTTRTKMYGINGSKISVTRTVKDAQGEIVSEQVFTSTYDPVNEIILEGPKEESENSPAA